VKAVQFDRYGGTEVLEVRDVERPSPPAGEVLVAVRAAGINPGEIAIREGHLHDRWPATFPSGEGTDLAGVVEELGEGVSGLAIGDEVLGWSERRSSHAELVVVPATQLTAKPAALSWEVAGSLFVASMAAYACVEAVAPRSGEVVAVSGAAGGVGSFAVQLALRTGARVIGLASEANHAWLRSRGVIAVSYGEGQGERIMEAAGGRLDAFIDTFGGGYVALALELGVAPERINTIADFDAIERLGVKGMGTHTVGSAAKLAEVAALAADGELEVPIAQTYPLAQVREAFEELSARKTHGKIVLVP
jgi:NADPH:quinone reductase-like Zn-dependent oxidoreductase